MLITTSIRVYRDYNLGSGYDANPFVRALAAVADIDETHKQETTLIEALNNYYLKFCPKSVYEYLDLQPSDAPGLDQNITWTAPYPWTGAGIDQDIDSMRQGLLKEAQKYGYYLNSKDGCSWCGPVSQLKIQLEAIRYLLILRNMRQYGFRLGFHRSNAINVTALIGNENKCCFLLQDGAHRFTAAAALGLSEIPYNVTGFIKRSDVTKWGNVKSGMYLPEGALKLFDRVMRGEPPSLLKTQYFLNGVSNNKKSIDNRSGKLSCEQTSLAAQSTSLFGTLTLLHSDSFFDVKKLNFKRAAEKQKKNKVKSITKLAEKVVRKFKSINRIFTLATSKPPNDIEAHPVTGDIYYGARAANYDLARQKSAYWKLEELYMRKTLRALDNVGNVLDVACGTGRFIPLYSEMHLNVTCLDSSIDMLNQVQLKAKGAGYSKFTLVEGMADKLPFKAAEYDLVVCFRFLSWIITADVAVDCLREIARTTRRYAILELCISKNGIDKNLKWNETIWNRLTRDSTTKMLYQCGLEVINSEEIADLPDHPGLTAFLCRKRA